MNNKNLQHYFLLALLFGVLIFAFFILRPFIYAGILALVCAIIFQPIHQKILNFSRGRKGLAALFTTIVIVVTILIPVIFLGINIFKEAQQFYFFIIGDSGRNTFTSISNSLVSSYQKYFPFEKTLFIDVTKYIEQGLAWLLNHFSSTFSNALGLLFNFLIFIFITYYALKDGPELKKIVTKLSPLDDTDDEAIFKKIKVAINSVIKGGLIVALIQGALVAIGFAIFGVPNIILWGIVATIVSLVPGLGTSIILIPAIVFVFLTGNIFLALGLLVWGLAIVGPVDGLLRPILIGRGIKIHPLIIFLSVVGGIMLFGPIGLLLGPLTISLLFAFLDIYISIRDKVHKGD
ncbi:MAG: AI-2E family transporter [Candidatus Staskawiczbacteria bacterium]|nr:AI-2E family transporter [Candidatus Staskawiczbacteria bacterium]